MAKWGEFDFSELEGMAKRFKDAQAELPVFFESCLRELAARLLAKVVPRTPVGHYNGNWVEFTTSTGKHVRFQTRRFRRGGRLRQGWMIGKIKRDRRGYYIEVINPVPYALYVEKGHRTANHKGWVEGRFMLKISEDELRRELPGILQRKQEAFLRRFLG